MVPGVAGPLTAEPEVTQTELTGADEFMLLGCDGL
jgi:serine/threonine protein phosphatase PrpC